MSPDTVVVMGFVILLLGGVQTLVLIATLIQAENGTL